MNFHPGNRVEPLIEADDTYARLEEAIRAAERTVHMAYWTIDPGLSEPNDRDTWGDLLADTAERGVTVRLIIADFDPILGRKHHRTAWQSYRRFLGIGDALTDRARRRIKIICSRHEATVGTAVRLLGQVVIQRHLAQTVSHLSELGEADGWDAMLRELGYLPGLWPHIRVGGGAVSSAQPTMPTAYPAVHHEKLCVIDDETVFLGGLDIDERRYDSQEHESHSAWHDVACRLTGPATSFFAEHFRERWNTELAEFETFLAEARHPEGVETLPVAPALEPLPESVAGATEHVGKAEVAPLRTLTRETRSSFSRSPKIAKAEIFDAYREAIAEAEQFIYIETQFLRSHAIVDCLVDRAGDRAALEVILLLPYVPDQYLDPGEPDAASRYGHHLQRQALERLEERLGPRFGVYTLMRDGPPRPDPTRGTKRIERDIVYVHAKTMVIDDRLAFIGSANLNGRSMATDTETAIAWREPGAIAAYRLALWKHALDVDAADWQPSLTEKWRAHAARNARVPAAERTGFVMPLPDVAREAFASDSLVIPSELV